MTADLAPIHPERIARLVARWEPRHWTILAATTVESSTSAEVAERAAWSAARRYSTGQAGLLLAGLASRGLVDRLTGPGLARWALTSRGADVLAYGRSAGLVR